jgi:3-oxoacyl-[acyl-carrier protein] reductase
VENFDKLFAVNVRAHYFLVQQLLPLLGDGASIILTSSPPHTRASVRSRPIPPQRAR